MGISNLCNEFLVVKTRFIFPQVVLGLHIVRGDNIAIIGELDEDVDSRLDLNSIKAEPILSIVH